MAEKLSLNARKNIKANDEKLKEICENIKEAADLPCDVTLDADMLAINNWCEKNGYKDRPAEIVDWVISGFLGNVKKDFANDKAKASLQAAWTTGVLKVVMGEERKDVKRYHYADIENGDLVITCVSAASNVGNCGNDLLDKLGDESGLSVKAAQNVEKFQEDRDTFAEEMKESTGIGADVTIEIEWPEWFTFHEKSYKDRGAEVLKWWTDGLKGNFKKIFANDDIAKNAVQAVWTTGVVKVVGREKDKKEKGYHKVSFDNGDLLLECFGASNVGQCGATILDDLMDPETNLPIKASIEWNKGKEKLEESYEAIKEATGLSSDVTLEHDMECWTKTLGESGYANRPAEVTLWIVDGLKKNLTNSCKVETTRDCIQEAWTTGVIKIVEGDKKQKAYHEVSFENGDLIITYKPGSVASNVGYCGNKIEEILIDSKTNLPLPASIEWNKYKEQNDEICEAIKEAVALTSDVTIEHDMEAWTASVAACGYANRPGEVTKWIVEGLKKNLAAICKEELTQEAIQEVWTTGVIKFAAGDEKQKTYHAVSFDNGDLLITYKPKSVASNVGNCGKDIEAQL